jgi:putative spermidine/putrescine transport system permease protein
MALAGIVLFSLPFVYLLLLSFTNNWNFPKLLPVSYNKKNWQEALSDNNGILHSLLISLLIASCVAILSTFFGFFISKAIAYHKRGDLLLFTCYFPLALSPVIFALLVNYYFIRISLSGTVAGIVIAQLMIALPFSILLLNSFWNRQIKSLEAISATLGANYGQTFIKVLLPVAKPQLLVCFIQTFLISWFEYGLTTIIGVGKIKTLTLKVYQYISEANVYYAAISSCIIILPIVALIWFNKRFIYHKIV